MDNMKPDAFAKLTEAAPMPPQHSEDEEHAENSCDSCGASLNDGEGYDGKCGNCVDRDNRQIATLGIKARQVATEVAGGQFAKQAFDALAGALGEHLNKHDHGTDVDDSLWNNAVDAFIKRLKEQLER